MMEEEYEEVVSTLEDFTADSTNLNISALLWALYDKHKDQQVLIEDLQQQIDDLRG